MLIQVLLGMNFDAAVVFVKTFLLLFRLALAILWHLKMTRLNLSLVFWEIPDQQDWMGWDRLQLA